MALDMRNVDINLIRLLEHYGNEISIHKGNTYTSYYLSGYFGLSTRDVEVVHFHNGDRWEGSASAFGEIRSLDEYDLGYFRQWLEEIYKEYNHD